MYSVKEMYFTLQGEGAHTGRAAVFLRFAGCNLWSGREQDRATAVCSFCDTDFVGTNGPGGGKFKTAEELAAQVNAVWTSQVESDSQRYVVCTGGEPLLQLDHEAIDALHKLGFEVGVETNGTQPAPPGLDWICVSPKSNAPLVLESGHELKLVFPQALARPERFVNLDFEHFYLQPMDGPDLEKNIQLTVNYCLRHPRWRLSLQTHKYLGLD